MDLVHVAARGPARDAGARGVADGDWPPGVVGDVIWGRLLLTEKTACQTGTTLACMGCCALLSAIPGPRVSALDMYVPYGARSFLYLLALAASELVQDALIVHGIVNEQGLSNKFRMLSREHRVFAIHATYPNVFRSRREFLDYMLPVWASACAILGFTTRAMDAQVHWTLTKNVTQT